jgi:PKD repeat protein
MRTTIISVFLAFLLIVFVLPAGAVVQPVEGGNELTVSGVILPGGAPVAAFLADPTTGTAPLTVTFTDQSTGTGIYSWNWSFGDHGWYNTTNVNQKNPVHVYAGAGTYLAQLTVCNAGSCDTTSPGKTITAHPSTSSLTVTSPNGGETWQRGTTHTITWSYTGSPGPNVKIVLLKGTTEIGTIASSAVTGNSGKGSYTWSIASSGITGSDFKVKVQSISQPIIRDISNAYFALNPATAQPTLTVTSPNGGETWQRGTTHTITWSYTGSPGPNVKIVLLKGTTEIGTIASSAVTGNSGKGSYTWSIASSGITGSDFKVKVQSISQPTITDTSNNVFTLTPRVQNPIAQYSQDKYYGRSPLTVHFTDHSRNNPTSYFWRFGDGSSSTEKNPTHQFTRPGFYIIQERVTNTAGSDSAYSAVIVTRNGWWWFR